MITDGSREKVDPTTFSEIADFIDGAITTDHGRAFGVGVVLAVLPSELAGYVCPEPERIVLVQALVRITCGLYPDTMKVDWRSNHGAGGRGL